jgi:hypothetical protein
MISIKQFLERRSTPNSGELLEAALQMGRLMIEAIATHVVRGRDGDLKVFARALKSLQRKMHEPPTALDLLEISSEASEAMETYARCTTEFIHAQNRKW